MGDSSKSAKGVNFYGLGAFSGGSVFRLIIPYFSHGELRFARPARHGVNNRYREDPRISDAKLSVQFDTRPQNAGILAPDDDDDTL